MADTIVAETRDIVQKAEALGFLKTFVKAIRLTGLEQLLRSKRTFTVFAPDDSAFYRLPGALIRDLLADRAQLEAAIKYHILPDKRILAEDIGNSQTAVTLAGRDLLLVRGNGPLVNNTRILQPDIECGNGIIHVIDSLLAP